MNKQTAYIIPYKHDGEDRLNNLKNTLTSLKYFLKDSIEIIVVEQGDTLSLYYNTNPFNDVKYISTNYYNKDFQLSWLLNIGACNTNKNILCFGDADTIVCENDLLRSIKSIECDGWDVIWPFYNTFSVNYRFNFDKDMYEIYKLQLSHLKRTNQSNIVILNRKTFFDLGGFDEMIDQSLTFEMFKYKVNSFDLKSKQNSGFAYHQSHCANDSLNYKMKKEKLTNLSINELKAYCEKQSLCIGDMNKHVT